MASNKRSSDNDRSNVQSPFLTESLFSGDTEEELRQRTATIAEQGTLQATLEQPSAKIDSFEMDESGQDVVDEDTSRLFERVIPEPAKTKPEEVRDRPSISVVDENSEPIAEGDYAFHQVELIERGKFTKERKGRAYFGRIDPTQPFVFEVSDRVCAIRAGAFFDPDDPKIEYGGTWFDWTLVRDDKNPDKEFWPRYLAEMKADVGRRGVDKFWQHEHITRRPIQITKAVRAGKSRVTVQAVALQIRSGPFVRYADHSRTVIWLELVTPGLVKLLAKQAGGREAEKTAFASTVRVGGRHFAAVELDGLDGDKFYQYTIELAPLPSAGSIPITPKEFEGVFPEVTKAVRSLIGQQLKKASLEQIEWLSFRTLRRKYDDSLRFATGSCRWYPGDRIRKKDWGPDMLDGLGDWLLKTPRPKWPHFLFFGGDQIYADEIGDKHHEAIVRGRFAGRLPGPIDSSGSVSARLVDGAWAGRFSHRYKEIKPTSQATQDSIKKSLDLLDSIYREHRAIRLLRDGLLTKQGLLDQHRTVKNRRELQGASQEAGDEKKLRVAISLIHRVEALATSAELYRPFLPYWKAALDLGAKNPRAFRYRACNFLLWHIPNFEHELPTLSDQSSNDNGVRKPSGLAHPSVAGGKHVADFAEYSYLYEVAWTTSRNVRVLLGNVPTFLMFDDHEVTDDWNWDAAWVRMIHNEKDHYRMWPKTITDALCAYWMYQGWGNKAPSQWNGDRRAAVLAKAQRAGTDALPELRKCIFTACVAMSPKDRKSSFQTGLSLDWHYRLPFEPPFLVPDCRSRRRMVSGDDDLRIIDHDKKSPQSETIDAKQIEWMREVLEKYKGPAAFIAPSTPLLMQKKVMSIMTKPEAFAKSWAGEHDVASILAALFDSTALGMGLMNFLRIFRRSKDLEHMIRDKSWRDLWGLVQGMRNKGSPVKTLVLVSGDVHHSYCMTANLSGSGRPKPELVQITSSGLQTTIRKDFTTSLAEELSSLVFDVGKYRLVPGFVSKNDTGDPDLVLYENAVALVDVSMGDSEVDVVVTYLSDKDKRRDRHVYRYTSASAYMEGHEPAVLVRYRRKRALGRGQREFQQELEGQFEFGILNH